MQLVVLLCSSVLAALVIMEGARAEADFWLIALGGAVIVLLGLKICLELGDKE